MQDSRYDTEPVFPEEPEENKCGREMCCDDKCDERRRVLAEVPVEEMWDEDTVPET